MQIMSPHVDGSAAHHDAHLASASGAAALVDHDAQPVGAGPQASASKRVGRDGNLTLPLATRERAQMLDALQSLLQQPVLAYIWAFRGVHPAALLLCSFVVSQVLHELLLYEIFEAYQRHDLARTAFEIISPLTLWLLVDTTLQIVLTLCGRGHRILARMKNGEVVVLHRKLFTPRPDRVEYRLDVSLALRAHQMGYAVDRLDTAAGRFYVWGRWRDVRLLLALQEAAHVDARVDTNLGPK
jgi:hypothetical protein